MNPLGIVPDQNITKIVMGSTFKKGEAYIVSNQSIVQNKSIYQELLGNLYSPVYNSRGGGRS